MGDLPDDAVDEAERLTRLARRAVDDAEAEAYREERDALLADHGYAARVREESDGAVLVCYPSEWVDEGTVDPTAVDDVDRGVERRLAGAGDGADWDEVAERNEALVERVADEEAPEHAANARALAEFASNHYAKPVADLTRAELTEFLTEYYPRNAWPSESERALVEESVSVTFEKTDRDCPLDG